MKAEEFKSLSPLLAAREPYLKLGCSILRSGENLEVRFKLEGRLQEVALARKAANPARRHRLWEGTCFELFLGTEGSPQYWEFNLSPAGHWNVYRFEDYRQGMKEETAWGALPFRVQRQTELLAVSLILDLRLIIQPGRELEAGVSAVLKGVGGEMSYWALIHPGDRPDFHRRDGFLLRL